VAFGYLKDPLFLVCFAAYWVNWSLEGYGVRVPLLRSYLNDLICIPFWIPIMLWVNRKLGLRRHDAPPLGHEIVIPMLLWAVVFEVVLPATHGWAGLAFADPYDVLCYALGACAGALFWAWWYGREGRPARQDSRPGSLRTSRSSDALVPRAKR